MVYSYKVDQYTHLRDIVPHLLLEIVSAQNSKIRHWSWEFDHTRQSGHALTTR